MRGNAAQGIFKRFGHIEALRGVSRTIEPGEIVALLCDNGAGKSTLAKVLSGHSAPSEGHVLMAGEPVNFGSVREAQAAGVEMVYQDLALAPDLTVAENIFLGREIPAAAPWNRLGMLDRAEMARQSSEVVKTFAVQGITPFLAVEDLSGGQRQAVAIARSLLRARIALLLDEPTAALGPRQSDMVCDAIRAVASKGIALMVVSHDLERMLTTATRIVVLHRGQIAMDRPSAGLQVPEIVSAMMGRHTERVEA